MDTMRGALLGVLKDRVPQVEDYDILAARAAEHGLAPRLAYLLQGRAVPESARTQLKRQALAAALVNLRAQADLGRLGVGLTGAGVDWAVVKGPVLADHWYTRSGDRQFSDLDLLVRPRQLPLVLELLRSSGATLVDRNWALALHQRRAELSFLLPAGTWLDLHWSLLNSAQLRETFALPTDQLLDRRVAVQLQSTVATTLDRVDTVLHLCLHTLLSGGQQLSWYRDIQQVMSHEGMDWHELLRRSAGSQADTVVAVALQRTASLTGFTVPTTVFRALARSSRAWLRAVAAADKLRPLGHPAGQRLSGQLFVRATRNTSLTSARALLSMLNQELITPLLHDDEHPWRRRRQQPVSQVNPLHEGRDDEAERDQYLRWAVEQT